MKSFVLHLKKIDWILVFLAVLLSTIGFLAIYTASLRSGDFLNLEKQMIFFGVGFLAMLIFSFFDWRNFRTSPYLILVIYFVCVISLLLLLFFAPEIRGTRSWYKIGPVSLDPIEFTKIALIILLAKYFSMRHIEMYNIRHIFLSGIYVLIPAALVFLQPNLGQVLVLVSIWLGMLIISGIRLKHFFLLIFIFMFIFILSWGTVLKDYQKQRILSFFIPELSDPLKAGWNQAQSKIAVGSGGIFGQGIGKGSQTQYGFLPEAHTDFIFATISEETGLFGAVAVLLIFTLFIWRIMLIAVQAKGNFPRLFAAGLAVLMVSQIFIHVGMNVGLLPVIGIPLPFISYGGSGLGAIFMALGILLNIKTSQ